MTFFLVSAAHGKVVCLNVEMEIRIRVSILETKCTVLEYTTLRMDIVTKGLGTRVVNKATECIHLGIVSLNVVNGIVDTLRPL